MSTDLLPAVHGDGIDALVRDALAPQADAIDQGRYPGDFMRALGRLALVRRRAARRASGGLGLDLAAQIEIIAQVGRVCGSTAFLAWCQSACAWYFQHTDNAAARERYLAPIARGEVLAGTGMSNCVKHLAGIERINLRARRDGEGYRVERRPALGLEPGPDHLVIAAAAAEKAATSCSRRRRARRAPQPAAPARPSPAWKAPAPTACTLERLDSSADVLAEPAAFEDYIGRIKPGFLLMQIGMGQGRPGQPGNHPRDQPAPEPRQHLPGLPGEEHAGTGSPGPAGGNRAPGPPGTGTRCSWTSCAPAPGRPNWACGPRSSAALHVVPPAT
ncbi:hypothetical protein CDEN61S_03926 [Castellaniella denitrificans]